jgi:hypothetical protein
MEGNERGFIYLVLNEINQHAHRLDEKPAQFKLADICQPVCEDLRNFFRIEKIGFFLVLPGLF